MASFQVSFSLTCNEIKIMILTNPVERKIYGYYFCILVSMISCRSDSLKFGKLPTRKSLPPNSLKFAFLEFFWICQIYQITCFLIFFIIINEVFLNITVLWNNLFAYFFYYHYKVFLNMSVLWNNLFAYFFYYHYKVFLNMSVLRNNLFAYFIYYHYEVFLNMSVLRNSLFAFFFYYHYEVFLNMSVLRNNLFDYFKKNNEGILLYLHTQQK